MISLSQQKTKALVDLHGWSAVILGFLLYAVVATGTVAVLSLEIQAWSIGKVQQGEALRADLDSIIVQQAAALDPKFLEDISISTSPSGHLELFFHTHRENAGGQTEEYGHLQEIDSSGRMIAQRIGERGELFATEEGSALSRFLVDIHTELHLPRPWGLLLTGILGLGMMVAAVSGFLMHRHLFRDMFLLRRQRSDVLKHRDVHTVAGTWGLPFAFVLAFTGSFFSFAASFGLPAMAMVAFGGDQELLIRTIQGIPEEESETAAPSTSINAVLNDSAQRGGVFPSFVSIMHYGRDDARITTFLPPTDTSYERKQYEYDGVSGALIRERPTIGTTPSAGSDLVALMSPLHFGNFANLLSKFVWVALGFASCYVIASGFTLWLQRRPHWQRFACFNSAFMQGLPLSMLMAGVGYMLAPLLGMTHTAAVPWFFVGTGVLCLLAAALAGQPQRFYNVLLGANTLLCLLLPLLRWYSSNFSWLDAVQQQNLHLIMIDCLLVLCGVFCLAALRRQTPHSADSSAMATATQESLA